VPSVEGSCSHQHLEDDPALVAVQILLRSTIPGILLGGVGEGRVVARRE
jgi:hypothetical protein